MGVYFLNFDPPSKNPIPTIIYNKNIFLLQDVRGKVPAPAWGGPSALAAV